MAGRMHIEQLGSLSNALLEYFLIFHYTEYKITMEIEKP